MKKKYYYLATATLPSNEVRTKNLELQFKIKLFYFQYFLDNLCFNFKMINEFELQNFLEAKFIVNFIFYSQILPLPFYCLTFYLFCLVQT